ncbi:MAG: YceD family protein [Alphaproteobacteria bacterium]
MTAPEFHRPVAVLDLPPAGQTIEIEANAAERAALAERFELLALDRLTARLTLKPIAGGPMLRVFGRFAAAATQACVVSWAPVPAQIEEAVDLRFGPSAEPEREVTIGFDEEEPPEPIEDGRIDLGELVAQLLALALDPYPRAPDAEVPAAYAPADPVGERAGKPNPFAALADRLKKDR